MSAKVLKIHVEAFSDIDVEFFDLSMNSLAKLVLKLSSMSDVIY